MDWLALSRRGVGWTESNCREVSNGRAQFALAKLWMNTAIRRKDMRESTNILTPKQRGPAFSRYQSPVGIASLLPPKAYILAHVFDFIFWR